MLYIPNYYLLANQLVPIAHTQPALEPVTHFCLVPMNPSHIMPSQCFIISTFIPPALSPYHSYGRCVLLEVVIVVWSPYLQPQFMTHIWGQRFIIKTSPWLHRQSFQGFQRLLLPSLLTFFSFQVYLQGLTFSATSISRSTRNQSPRPWQPALFLTKPSCSIFPSP